jgi:tRNA A-37 threonylcarbamoyl transferase component Bud32
MNANEHCKLALWPGQAGRLNPVCDRFEQEWRAGGRPRLEDWLALVEDGDRAALLRELLALDLHYRGLRGERPQVEEYRLRLPSYPGVVDAALAALRMATPQAPPAPSVVGVQPTVPSRAASPAGQVLSSACLNVPGYEILDELGRGGMGVVYKARHLQLNRIVALKMVLGGGHASREERERFLVEAKAVAALHHANIVQVHDFGQHDGMPYMALEFINGGSVNSRLRDNPLQPHEAASLVEQLAHGLAAAHAKDIVHRDLKPHNVLLAVPDGCDPSQAPLTDCTPKVTDFGLAKRVAAEPADAAEGLTVTGAIMGTPSYMAPEQAEGKSNLIGPLADVYALGAILYECLTGRPPFRGPTALETIRQAVNEEPVRVRQLQPHCPRDLETICHMCLRKEPARRYGSANALAEDLRRYRAGEPILARPVGRLERGWKWVKRRPVPAGLLSVTVLLLLALVALSVGWFFLTS